MIGLSLRHCDEAVRPAACCVALLCARSPTLFLVRSAYLEISCSKPHSDQAAPFFSAPREAWYSSRRLPCILDFV
jgi:hypothetical protein